MFYYFFPSFLFPSRFIASSLFRFVSLALSRKMYVVSLDVSIFLDDIFSEWRSEWERGEEGG